MFDWTTERDETLRTMLAAGATVAEAAKTLGVTRNAAMGRASRRKFPMNAPNTGGWDDTRRREAREMRAEKVRARAERKNPLVIKPKHRSFDLTQAVFSPKSPPKPLPVQRPSHAAPSLRLTLMEIRDNDCHFIEGDDHLYCGHPTEYLQAYCPAHCRVVWQPVRARTS